MEEKDYKLAPLSTIHRQLFLCLVLGQIACGYALGIAGTAVTQATVPLALDSFWIGLIGAGTLIGLSGSLVVGIIADKMGRHNLFLVDMILFTIISLTQLFVSNVIILLILRIGLGLTIAIDYTVGSALLTEWLPADKSAKYQSYLIIFWTIGYVVSFIVGLLMKNGLADFHLIFMSSAIPGAIVALVRIFKKIPESPSWLAINGRAEEGNQLVNKYLGNGFIIKEITNKQEVEKVSWKELFAPMTRRNTLVGGIFYACQVFPYFGVGIFLPILVAELNMGDANISSILYIVFCMIGAFVGVYLCNRISRRAFLLSTFYLSAAALAIMILAQGAPIAITIMSFSAFALIMSIAVVMENPYPPELFNTRMRGSGVGAVIAMSRIGAAAGTFLLPILVEKTGVYGTLSVCLIILLIGGVFCHLFAPETSLKYGHPVE